MTCYRRELGLHLGSDAIIKWKNWLWNYTLAKETAKLEAGVSKKLALVARFLYSDVATLQVAVVQDNQFVSDQPNSTEAPTFDDEWRQAEQDLVCKEKVVVSLLLGDAVTAKQLLGQKLHITFKYPHFCTRYRQDDAVS